MLHICVQISMTKAERRDPDNTYNKITVGDLYTNISNQVMLLKAEQAVFQFFQI